MRELTSHKVNGCNDALTVEVLDEPVQGNACHRYAMVLPDLDALAKAAYSRYGSVTDFKNYQGLPMPEWDALTDKIRAAWRMATGKILIEFQNGPINVVGTNGVTHEALLTIIEDRLVGFQSGPYACADNAEALAHIRGAMECLQRRTKARLARGVEGTHTV